MNADEIALLCNALLIKEKERPVRTLDGNLKERGEKRLALCLVGKIMKKKLVNREVFKEVMNKIWRVNGGVEIEPVEGNIFAFFFKHMEDMQRILRGGPWNFDQAIIVFDKPAGIGEIAKLQFRYVDFWVQIHSIPLIYMTQEIGSFLGGMIGEVHDVDLGYIADGSGRFLRVRVTVETKLPLQRCLRVDLLGDGKITTMLLRYERLQDYCFRCDRIGHKMDECIEECEDRDMSVDIDKKLGVWLRASSPQKRNLKSTSKSDNRNWGRFKGSGVFSAFDNTERRTSDNWRGRKMEKMSSVSGDDHRGFGSSVHGKLEEARLKMINEGELNTIGENKNYGLASIPAPKIPFVSIGGDNEKTAITDGPDGGSDGFDKGKDKAGINTQVLGHDSPTYLSKLMEGKLSSDGKSDYVANFNLKTSGKWKRVKKGSSEANLKSELGEKLGKRKGESLITGEGKCASNLEGKRKVFNYELQSDENCKEIVGNGGKKDGGRSIDDIVTL
ncbi:hypothetical protein EZV62_015781 [Acer yangbiense]|uniref:CCHC-type domain-containing protein n=1 Tax=Acer yangbiense TaxID=1000413 RepID=A0A5C7HP34_9ROSI|nr:hypothetical protein EZV62_015781 [Acer yangbiense]